LAAEQDIILMDEPFSALDPLSRKQLQDLVLDLHHQTNTTILFVTHDMNEAIRLGNRIGVMYHGKLQQVGKPSEITTKPANDLVASFFIEQPKTTIKNVIDAGFYHSTNSKNKVDLAKELVDQTQLRQVMSLVSKDESINRLAELLTTKESVVLTGNVEITREDFLKFLASM
jgi:osmoprotectant transport system ATP-binding protein